jgi:hypothetical protein
MKAVAVVAALTFALVISPIHAQDQHPPFPASLMAAKTVYIDNQTGDAKITERANDAISKWGRFQISKDAKDADLILRFTADTKGKPTPPNKDIDISPTQIHFSVLDQDHRELWFASKNKPFHSQTQMDLDEFKKQIEDQEKSHGG